MKNILIALSAIGLFACNLFSQTPVDTPAPTVAPVSVPTETQVPIESTEEVPMAFEFSSPAFGNGEPIPPVYSCKGRDVSPALTWTEPPAGTQSFALIMDDPDAPMGTWVHWVIFNIPTSARGLPEGVPTDPELGDGSRQGITSARTNGYHGPCPPSGVHRYFFKLYALDTTLSLPTSAGKQDLLQAMEGHILANLEWMGTFAH